MKVVPGWYRHEKDGVYRTLYNIIGVAVHTESGEQFVLSQALDPFHGDFTHMPLQQFSDGMNTEFTCRQVSPAPTLVSPLLHSYDLQPGLYAHMKGARYNVLGISTNAEAGEKMVAYQPLEGEHRYRFFLRPLATFRERVKRPGQEHAVQRFFLLDPYREPRIAEEYQD